MKSATTLLRTTLTVALLALGAAVGPVQAQVNINIGVNPPAPRYEAVPQVQSGYVWAPGYWAYKDRNYVWVQGRPIVQREGHRWVPDRWEANKYRAGYWEHDERREERHHGKKDHDDDRRGNFCPPGQAKKGNC